VADLLFGFNYQKNGMVKNLKKIELFFVIVVLILFVVLADRYIFKSSFFSHIKAEITTYFNDKKFEKTVKENIESSNNNGNIVSKKLDLKLVRVGNDWSLIGSDNYKIVTDKEKIAIATKDNSTGVNFAVDVIGVDTYFPIRNTARLDIPVGKNSETFRVYEQEDFLPILGYHYVVPDDQEIPESKKFLEVHASKFEEQIDYMTNMLGCRWFTLGELMENYILKNEKIPKQACAINFDDGRKDGYTRIFPILEKYGVVATFYVITDLLGKSAYMTWEQIDELYRAGHEIGSHTLFGGSILNTKWFEEKFGQVFNHEDLVSQVKDSKEKLEKRGYEIKTFAYPLGEWSDDIVQVVKESGYIAARDTENDLTLDRRSPTVSYDQNYIWHMHYHKPELQSLEELKKSTWYNTWWQFEDVYVISADSNKNIKNLSSLELTEDSYEIVTLPDRGDKIKNKFIVNHDGEFTIEIFGSTGESLKDFYSYLENIKISIDDKAFETKTGDKGSCLEASNRYYCSYFVYSHLQKGVHIIEVENDNNGFVRVDKFRIFREIPIQDSYEVIITEFKNNSDKTADSLDSGVTFSDNFNENKVIEESGGMNESSNPYWWINSGAFLIKEGGVGKTLFGGISTNSKWQNAYLQHNAVDTDNGYHPQNIFRLITRSKWQNFQQTIYAKIEKYNLSESRNRSESNGLLLFNRYIDSDNLYYTGIRVDGTAVIKKKINGNYYTLAQKSFYKADVPYNRDTNPNIIPSQKWIGLRSEIKTNPDNTVSIKFFIDKDKTGNWILAVEAKDDGKTYGGSAILSEDYAGIRTDFMDIEFDDYKIIKQ